MEENPYKAPVDRSFNQPDTRQIKSTPARKILETAVGILAAIVGWIVTGYVLKAIRNFLQ
jgi:hypothetical protein